MILVETGHTKLAEEMYDEDFRLGWGSLPSGTGWADAPDPEDLGSTELILEVGRIIAQVKEYVLPDNNGVIDIDGVKWTISGVPTKFVYLKFVFEQEMNSSDSIYQLGVFTNTVPSPGSEAEPYLQPSNIDNTGKLLLLENQPVVFRNSATREIFEYVITF